MAGTFSIMDWVVFAGTLVISLLIGLYYAVIKKQRTNAELLVGGRNMAIFPTAMSLLATYMSAILVLGKVLTFSLFWQPSIVSYNGVTLCYLDTLRE